MSPVLLMPLAIIIPMIYCQKWKKENFERVLVLFIILLAIVIFYQIVVYLNNILSYFGYFLGKFILFTLLPLVIIIHFEKWKIKEGLIKLGISKEKIWMSIFLGLGALMVTLFLGLIIEWGQEGNISFYWNTVMFFEAFNEEFLFRGVLFLYLWKITDIKVAYATSIIAFTLAHPQHFTSPFLASTIAQGILLAIVTHKTKNIIGPWLSHGLNRTLIQIIRATLF